MPIYAPVARFIEMLEKHLSDARLNVDADPLYAGALSEMALVGTESLIAMLQTGSIPGSESELREALKRNDRLLQNVKGVIADFNELPEPTSLTLSEATLDRLDEHISAAKANRYENVTLAMAHLKIAVKLLADLAQALKEQRFYADGSLILRIRDMALDAGDLLGELQP
jgi:hypothetical protein